MILKIITLFYLFLFVPVLALLVTPEGFFLKKKVKKTGSKNKPLEYLQPGWERKFSTDGLL